MLEVPSDPQHRCHNGQMQHGAIRAESVVLQPVCASRRPAQPLSELSNTRGIGSRSGFLFKGYGDGGPSNTWFLHSRHSWLVAGTRCAGWSFEAVFWSLQTQCSQAATTVVTPVGLEMSERLNSCPVDHGCSLEFCKTRALMTNDDTHMIPRWLAFSRSSFDGAVLIRS